MRLASSRMLTSLPIRKLTAAIRAIGHTVAHKARNDLYKFAAASLIVLKALPQIVAVRTAAAFSDAV